MEICQTFGTFWYLEIHQALIRQTESNISKTSHRSPWNFIHQEILILEEKKTHVLERKVIDR